MKNIVVVMAGGEGKRLRPLTETTPKPMLPVNGRPMLEWIIIRFIKQGFTEFRISCGYKGEQILEYFGDGSKLGCHIEYIWDIKGPLGTAGALHKLQAERPFIVINGDVLVSANFSDLLRYHETHEAIATIGATMHVSFIPYGVLRHDSIYSLEEVLEKPEIALPVSAGVYILSPEALKHLDGSAIDMPELLTKLIPEKVVVFPISGDWMDVGNNAALQAAQGINE